ncbi:MAG: hypothetical protein JWN47_1918, partial [Frankiales bacterium]|nr:hypothetical protein [Frankiales bacterium]
MISDVDVPVLERGQDTGWDWVALAVR